MLGVLTDLFRPNRMEVRSLSRLVFRSRSFLTFLALQPNPSEPAVLSSRTW